MNMNSRTLSPEVINEIVNIAVKHITGKPDSAAIEKITNAMEQRFGPEWKESKVYRNVAIFLLKKKKIHSKEIGILFNVGENMISRCNADMKLIILNKTSKQYGVKLTKDEEKECRAICKIIQEDF